MKRIFCLLTIFFCTLFAFNASAQEERDSPRRGEGISVFLERNKRPGRAYYKEFLELNKKRLKGKEELRLGVKYVLPPLRNGGNSVDGGKKVRQTVLPPNRPVIEKGQSMNLCSGKRLPM